MLQCCLFQSPVPCNAPPPIPRPEIMSQTRQKLRGIRQRRGDAAWGADTELPAADLFLGSLPVIIPEISNMRPGPERPPDPPTMMEQIGRMARPKTNCAMAVITDNSRPPRAIMHPHEKTGFRLKQPDEGLPPSTYRGHYQGWQQSYGSLKMNVPYEPLATRNRLPSTSWEPNQFQRGDVLFRTTPGIRHCYRRNCSTFTMVDPDKAYNGNTRFKTMNQTVHHPGIFRAKSTTIVGVDCRKLHRAQYE